LGGQKLKRAIPKKNRDIWEAFWGEAFVFLVYLQLMKAKVSFLHFAEWCK